MNLVGKMDLCIVYEYGYEVSEGKYRMTKFDRTIKDETKLKEFMNELIELKTKGAIVRVLEVYNNLGY